MEIMNRSNPTQKILVLITVIAFALTGWLVGHILRFSMMVYDIQHPPLEEINPQIKNGLESEGIRREVALTGNLALQLLPNEGTLYLGQVLLDGCIGNTYYTSLPAKCRSADGKLVRVGGTGTQRLFIPPIK